MGAEENAVESSVGDSGIDDLNDPRLKGNPQRDGKILVQGLDGGAFLDGNQMTTENDRPFCGELNSEIPFIDASSKVANDDLSCKKKSDQVVGKDPTQVTPRVRPRSSTPGDQNSDVNSDVGKRQAIVCDFFAKGWCIKGNKCKFIHVRDHAAIASQHSEGIAHVAEKKSELPDDEVSSICKTHRSNGEESPEEKSGMHEVPIDGDGCSIKIARKSIRNEFEKADWCRYSSPVANGTYSSSSPKTKGVYGNENLEDMNFRRGYMPDDQNTSASTSSNYRTALPFGYSFGNTDALTSQEREVRREYHNLRSTSLKRSSLPFSVFESEVDSHRLAAEPRSKIPYDWIPSVPFRPLFFITQRLLSTVNLYDPIRDCIGQNASASTPGTHVWKNNNNVVRNGVSELEFSSSKYPMSGQNSHGKVTSDFPGKDESVRVKEWMESAGTQWQNQHALKAEKLLNSEYSRDASNDCKMSNDSDTGRQGDGTKYNAGNKAGKAAQKTEADADMRVDGYLYKESKVFKCFHAALVEFVKELLKPAWHDGHLSKDAHKLIVKKAVDKVLVTLQPHQIPSCPESVKHYLDLSQPKLAKLVEGYVDKYRSDRLAA